MQTVKIDRLDREILKLLQTEPEITAVAVGERIGLSQTTCWRRIQRLRDEGLIQDQVVTLDRKKAGLNALIFAQVKLSSQGRGDLTEFSDAIRSFPEVLDCYVLMWNVDFLLRIVAADIDAYEKFFFDKLSTLPGVQEITSSIALSEIKHTTALPL